MSDFDKYQALILSKKEELMTVFGVNRLAIFGSLARGSIEPRDDIDIIVESDLGLSMLELMHIRNFLEDLTHRIIDITVPESFNNAIDKNVSKEKIYVF
jgi:predicted nucleotidyltransferase